MSDESWYGRFKDCMDAMYLPVPPPEFFASTIDVRAMIEAISTAVATSGTDVTIAELIGTGVLSEFLAPAAPVTATAYAGACAGCVVGVLASTSRVPRDPRSPERGGSVVLFDD